MKKCEGIYSLIGKVNHKSAIYGFELLKEENIHPRQMPLIIHLKKCEGCTQKRVSREDAGQTVYAKRNDWTNGKEWIYREKTRRKKIQEKAEFILLRREEVSVKTVIKNLS